MIGTIKTVNHSFAFVVGPDNVPRFFHREYIIEPTDLDPNTDLSTILFVGMLTEFVPALHASKGPRALRVRLLGSTPGNIGQTSGQTSGQASGVAAPSAGDPGAAP